MSKPLTSSKPTVELRASRIRRDPVPLTKPAESAKNYWDPSEWETWTVVVGVMLFGVAIAIIVVGFSEMTSR